MKNFTQKTVIAAFIIILNTAAYGQGQTILSEFWTGEGGELAVFYRNVTKTDNQSNVYVAGSTLNVNNNNDIIIQKFDSEGNLKWEQTFNGAANMDDMASDIFIDNDYNVFVTGASVNNSNDNFDLVVLKYNSSGILLWSYYYNNGGSPTPYDAGTAILGDNNGKIYVTGGSFGNTSNADYVTLCLNEDSGNQIWLQRYDYTKLNDVATQLKLDGSNLYVSGGSQISDSPNRWELATLVYNISTGSLLNIRRSSGSATHGVDEVHDLTVDNLGNIYVTGAVVNQGTGYDISLYKLNSQLVILWEKHFDSSGMEDKGFGVKTDSQGNVYVAGYVSTLNEGKNYALLKYDAGGTLQWSREFNGLANLDDEAVQLCIDANDNVFVTGATRNISNSDYLTLGYTSDGELFAQVSYNGPVNLNDKPTAIAIDLDGNIIVVGQIEDVGGKFKNLTVKYARYEKSFDPVMVNGVASHNNRELLIRFDRSSIIYSAIDNKEFLAGTLSDFVTQNTLDQIEQKLQIDVSRLETYKIFMRMTTADTISVTRLGDTVRIEDFWATLSVFFPETYEVQRALDSLNTLIEIIHYAEPNYIGEIYTAPNDLIYSYPYPNGQTGLYDPVHGIEVELAWDKQVGQSYTKVGVFDSGINWRHEDFGDGTWNGSKIEGGWDYYNNVHPSNQATPDPDGHGTAVAGIIGALRNNTLGIAGIAGGDVQQGNTGCQLFTFGIPTYVGLTPNQIINVLHSNAAAAIVEGAVQTPGFGYGLDIQNHSWGSIHHSTTLQNAVKACFEQSCLFVAASGNEGNTTINYPATYKDEWVLKVGANDATGGKASFSTYGNNLDIVAPGTNDIYTTLDHNNNSGYSYNGDGTSFAAPHAAGVSALLHSQHNTNNGYPNNLAPEDIEVFLKSFKTDVTIFPSTPGYDQFTGHGRLNADFALEKLSLPEYFIKHSGGQASPLQTTASGLQVTVLNPINGVASGNYFADRYQVTYSFIDIFAQNQTVLSHWPRFSSSVGVSAANPITGETWFTYTPTINQNVASISTTTFCWHILTSINWQTVNKWIPAPPNALKTAYSLYVKDNSVTAIEESQFGMGVNIYPTPTNNHLTIEFDLLDKSEVSLELYDATGRMVVSHKLGTLPNGFQSITLNVSNLSNGLYLCNIKAGETMLSRRIIKNKIE